MKHSDYVTHISNEEDVPFLKSKLFDVNMRLFKTSDKYREIVLSCCTYIQWLARTKMEGYKKPHGMSGANAAIPFNIIGIVKNRGQADEYVEIMINPKIIMRSRSTESALSNCGSLTLDRPIEIQRSKKVGVEWYDQLGNLHQDTFERSNGGFTVQHEVDHNLGVLITDRQ